VIDHRCTSPSNNNCGNRIEVASLENLGTNNDEVHSLSTKMTKPLNLQKPHHVVQQGLHYPHLLQQQIMTG